MKDFRQNGNISSWRAPGSVRTLNKCWISLLTLRKGLKTPRRLRDQQTAAAQSCSVFDIHRDAVWTDWLLFFFVFIFSSEGSALWLLQEKSSKWFFFFFLFYKFLELILLIWNFFMQQFLSMSIFDLGIYFILTQMLQSFSRIMYFFLDCINSVR